MSEESDIEMKSALPVKTKKKIQASPTEDLLVEKKAVEKNSHKEDAKKLTTKVMINQALADLKGRKGASLHAIKKYLKENYDVDTEKSNYIIKRSIKKAVEAGTILQTKGTGASGSFKLIHSNTLTTNKSKKPKIDRDDKGKSKTLTKTEKTKTKEKETSEKTKTPKTKPKENKFENKNLKTKKEKNTRKEKLDGEKTGAGKKTGAGDNIKKVKKSTKSTRTPLKKKTAMMKRKSIGSIIKAPKMKPKAKG